MIVWKINHLSNVCVENESLRKLSMCQCVCSDTREVPIQTQSRQSQMFTIAMMLYVHNLQFVMQIGCKRNANNLVSSNAKNHKRKKLFLCNVTQHERWHHISLNRHCIVQFQHMFDGSRQKFNFRFYMKLLKCRVF